MDIELFKIWSHELPEAERNYSGQNEIYKVRGKTFSIIGQDNITIKCRDSHDYQQAITNPGIVPSKSMVGRNWVTITKFDELMVEDMADFIVHSYKTIVSTFAKPVREKLLDELKHDIDSPWKDILDMFFKEFIIFFYPDIGNDIDWTKTPVFMDKELNKIIRKSETGKRYVDKLVKVWRTNGLEAWVLLHIEVQSQVQEKFPERMLIYSNRLMDIYRKPVASLAILADDDPNWRPSRYSAEIWGSKKNFEFPIIKLTDYKNKWKKLEKSDNPFAVVVMAHLKMLETKKDKLQRLHWKLELTKMLKAKNFKDDEINALFKFIDWLLTLPTSLTMAFEEKISKYHEEGKMRYITSLELYAMRKGRTEGRTEGRTDGVIGQINLLNQVKEYLPKGKYDTMIQPLQLQLQELQTKYAPALPDK